LKKPRRPKRSLRQEQAYSIRESKKKSEREVIEEPAEEKSKGGHAKVKTKKKFLILLDKQPQPPRERDPGLYPLGRVFFKVPREKRCLIGKKGVLKKVLKKHGREKKERKDRKGEGRQRYSRLAHAVTIDVLERSLKRTWGKNCIKIVGVGGVPSQHPLIKGTPGGRDCKGEREKKARVQFPGDQEDRDANAQKESGGGT